LGRSEANSPRDVCSQMAAESPDRYLINMSKASLRKRPVLDGCGAFLAPGPAERTSSGFRYSPLVITAPIDTKLAPFNQNIWLAGVETMRSTIPEGTPKSFAIRPIASVALIDI
jgi:hypothetical protein